MNNPLLKRLTSSTINDKLPSTFKNSQGQPLICLATISVQNQPSYYLLSTDSDPPSYITYNALNTSYSSGQLVFNSYGSLTDIKNFGNQSSQFFSSPFDPAYPNITPPTPGQTLDVINGADNAYVYGLMQKFSTSNGMSGSTYVSPKNAKWILNVSQDVQGNNVYKIFFNPLQNINLTSTELTSNLSTICNIISNADPLCFCNASSTICTDAALGGPGQGSNLQSKSSSDYNKVKANCNCLNNQCVYAMRNENNNYISGMTPCSSSVSACGQDFSFSSGTGVASSSNKLLSSVCGVSTGSASNGGSQPSDTKDSNSNTGAKIGISIAIIVVLLAIAYFLI